MDRSPANPSSRFPPGLAIMTASPRERLSTLPCHRAPSTRRIRFPLSLLRVVGGETREVNSPRPSTNNRAAESRLFRGTGEPSQPLSWDGPSGYRFPHDPSALLRTLLFMPGPLWISRTGQLTWDHRLMRFTFILRPNMSPLSPGFSKYTRRGTATPSPLLKCGSLPRDQDQTQQRPLQGFVIAIYHSLT